MRIFPGLEKGAVCIKLHEQELITLLKIVRHLKTTPSPIVASFIEQSERVIARTIVRDHVKGFLEEDQSEEVHELPKA